jgi:carbon monoxide dehydrogenase subunit G
MTDYCHMLSQQFFNICTSIITININKRYKRSKDKPLEITGNHPLPATKEEVWQLLNTPEVLQNCIPGCETLEQISETEYSALVIAKLGPVKAKFNSQISLENLDPPKSYTISGKGNGGIAGFARGKADILLQTGEHGLELVYKAEIQIGGKIAQVGSRLFKSSINKIIKQFFKNFIDVVESGKI